LINKNVSFPLFLLKEAVQMPYMMGGVKQKIKNKQETTGKL